MNQKAFHYHHFDIYVYVKHDLLIIEALNNKTGEYFSPTIPRPNDMSVLSRLKTFLDIGNDVGSVIKQIEQYIQENRT